MGSRAVAVHDAECPEIGPICAERPEPPQQHHTTLLATDIRLFGEYGLVPRLAIEGMLPLRIAGTTTLFTDLSDRPISLDYPSIHHRNQTLIGIGDPQLLLQYSFDLAGLTIGARGGVSIPLGTVHEDPYRLGEEGLPHEHIQFGTGTWDPIVGLDASAPVGGFTLAAFGAIQAPLYEGLKVPRGRPQHGRHRRLAAFRHRHPAPLRAGSPRTAGALARKRAHRGRQPRPHRPLRRARHHLEPGEWMLSADVRVRAYSHVVNAQLDMPVVLQLGIGTGGSCRASRSCRI